MNPAVQAEEQYSADLFKAMGYEAIRFENFTYRLAEMLTTDCDVHQLRRYCGGFWDLQVVGDEPTTALYWYKLNSNERFRYIGPGNSQDEVIDAEMLSMVVVLMVTSDLCAGFFELASKMEAAGSSADNVAIYQVKNEYFADLHHALKDHFFTLLEGDQERLNLLFRLID